MIHSLCNKHLKYPNSYIYAIIGESCHGPQVEQITIDFIRFLPISHWRQFPETYCVYFYLRPIMLSLCTRSVYAMSESAASCMHTPMWLTRSHQCSYMDKQCVAVWRLQVPTQCHPYISPTLFVTTGCPALIHNQIVHHRNKVQLRLSARTLV